MTIASGVTIQFICSAPNDRFPPTWLVNGTAVGTIGHDGCRSIISGREATLTIDGNRTLDSLSVVCEVLKGEQLLTMHNTTLTIQG